jgi:transcriptional regulator with XRE-family HTH domain
MNLALMLQCWRHSERLTLKEAADRIGIGYTTLSKIERGFAMDGATLAVILRWALSA